MSSNGNLIHWDFSMFQFSGMNAVCEFREPFTSSMGIKNRWPEDLREQSIKTVEVQWKEKSMQARIWKNSDMIQTFKTGILKYKRRALETVAKFICMDEKLLRQRNPDKIGNKLWVQIFQCLDNKYGFFFFFQHVMGTLESFCLKE